MTRTEELLALAEAATPIDTDLYGDRYFSGPYSQANLDKSQHDFIAKSTPETIKQLIELVRLQHEALLELEPYIPANVEAIAAFNKFEQGGE